MSKITSKQKSRYPVTVTTNDGARRSSAKQEADKLFALSVCLAALRCLERFGAAYLDFDEVNYFEDGKIRIDLGPQSVDGGRFELVITEDEETVFRALRGPSSSRWTILYVDRAQSWESVLFTDGLDEMPKARGSADFAPRPRKTVQFSPPT